MRLESAKKMRRNPTLAKRHMWHYLRNRQLLNCKFKRQYIIGKFVVDFICLEVQLVVEVDGLEHLERKKYDDKRTHFLESKGYSVIRFWNEEILSKPEKVLEILTEKLSEKLRKIG